MILNIEAKKNTLRLLHHNVAVVSSGKGEDLISALVTWFTQSSFEPPILTMAIKAESRLLTTIKKEKFFIVSLVKKGDKELAGKFFKPQLLENNTIGGFSGKVYETGGFILSDSPAWLACSINTIVPEGDHHVILANIVQAGINSAGDSAMCLTETGWKYGG
jgi:flavin reductase (DIM6/NTAB) family NADH-FMN oxidoreductase RutF